MTTIEKLTRIQNFGTRYELVADRGEDRVLICYTPRKSLRGIYDAVMARSAHIVRLTGAERTGDASGMSLPIGDWLIHFSGRTQREAIIEGENQYVGEAN